MGSTWLRGRHEHRSWRRDRLLAAGTEFTGALQAAFGPVQEAIRLRFDEPDELEEDEGDDAGHEEADFDEDPDPREFWAPATLGAFEDARNAVLLAESRLPTLFVLLPPDSLAVFAAQRALDMLGTAVGSLLEMPRDAKTWSQLYEARA